MFCLVSWSLPWSLNWWRMMLPLLSLYSMHYWKLKASLFADISSIICHPRSTKNRFSNSFFFNKIGCHRHGEQNSIPNCSCIVARKHRKSNGFAIQSLASHSFQSFEWSRAIRIMFWSTHYEHIHLFSDNVHAVRRACAVSITDVMDALKIDDFKNELLPSLISLYSSCGNYQIQSNLLYTFQNVLLSPLLSSNEDCTTEIQTLLIKELSVFPCFSPQNT